MSFSYFSLCMGDATSAICSQGLLLSTTRIFCDVPSRRCELRKLLCTGREMPNVISSNARFTLGNSQRWNMFGLGGWSCEQGSVNLVLRQIRQSNKLVEIFKQKPGVPRGR